MFALCVGPQKSEFFGRFIVKKHRNSCPSYDGGGRGGGWFHKCVKVVLYHESSEGPVVRIQQHSGR